MTPVKIEVLALYYSSAEVADVDVDAGADPIPIPMPLLGFLCFPRPLLGRDDGLQRFRR